MQRRSWFGNFLHRCKSAVYRCQRAFHCSQNLRLLQPSAFTALLWRFLKPFCSAARFVRVASFISRKAYSLVVVCSWQLKPVITSLRLRKILIKRIWKLVLPSITRSGLLSGRNYTVQTRPTRLRSTSKLPKWFKSDPGLPHGWRKTRNHGHEIPEACATLTTIHSNMAPVAEPKKEKETSDKKEDTKSKDGTKKEEEPELVRTFH